MPLTFMLFQIAAPTYVYRCLILGEILLQVNLKRGRFRVPLGIAAFSIVDSPGACAFFDT